MPDIIATNAHGMRQNFREQSDGTFSPATAFGDQLTQVAGFSASGTSVLDVFFAPPVVGSGVTYNQASGSLNILSGTTVNAEFLARSVNTYRGALRLRHILIASQRIANSNLAVLLADLIGEGLAYSINSATSVTVFAHRHTFTAQNVGQFVFIAGVTGAAGVPGRYAIASVDPNVSITFTVSGWPASGVGTCTLFGRNYVRNLFTGTTATNVAVDSQRNGWATGDTTATINTTASPGTLIQAELTGREVIWADSLRASATAPVFATRASRYENVIDVAEDLYVWVWQFNGTTAPASSTTWTMASVSIEAFPNAGVYLQGIRALGDVNSLPVRLLGSGNTISIAGSQTLATLTGGPAAEDAATTSNPHIMGGVVRTAAAPTTLVAGDAARLTMSAAGAAVVQPFAVPDLSWLYPAAAGGILNTTTAVTIRAAQAASIRNYITNIQVQSEPLGSATDLVVRDGAAGPVLWRVRIPTGGLPLTDIKFAQPLRGTAATLLEVATLTASVTGAVYFNAQGHSGA